MSDTENDFIIDLVGPVFIQSIKILRLFGAPVASISTFPSGVFLTQPDRFSSVALSKAKYRNPTP